jgi:hypothetical protein
MNQGRIMRDSMNAALVSKENTWKRAEGDLSVKKGLKLT